MLDPVIPAELAIQGSYRDLTRRTGGRVVAEDGLCHFFGVHPSSFIVNGGFRTDPGLAPREAIERTEQAFRALGRLPLLLTFERADSDLDAALSAAGWVMAIALPVMVRSEPVAESPVPPRVAVRRVDPEDAAGRGQLKDILRRGLADTDEERGVIEAVFSIQAAIDPPNAAAFRVDLDGAPAACAAVYREDEGAVVGWVATIPESRRRGLGRLATAAATNAGFALGADLVTLQASPMGTPLYASMGYETVTSSRVWVALADR